MKICMASDIFWPRMEGGAEISARLGAEALAKQHDVCVISLGHADAGESVSDAGYRIVRIPFRNAYLPSPVRHERPVMRKVLWHLRNGLGAVRTGDLVAVLRREAPDILYIQNATRMQPALFNAARKLNIPIVQHVRDYGLLCPRASMFRSGRNCERQCWDCRILSAPSRRAGADVTHAIAVSAFVSRRLQNHGALVSAEWSVMHNTNSPGNAVRSSPMRHHGKPLTFGYLGAISREKGISDLIDAFSRLETEAALVIGGRGDPLIMSELQRRTQGKPVEWLGHVSPETLYDRADIIVVPSVWYEPQSRVLVEAAMWGLPVIASDRGGNRELVETHRTGWLYDPDAPDALLALMQRAMRHWSDPAEAENPFPGLDRFAGTAEQSRYYERLEAVLERARRTGRPAR